MPVYIPRELGLANAGWGVCGFTSTFYAMWALNPGMRPALINAPQPFTVLAEIKTYLRTLQASGEAAKLTAIRDFTRSFGSPYDTFTIDAYIERINGAVNLSADAIKGNQMFGIAMPPQCVADYVRRMWQFDCSIEMGNRNPGSDGIIGVKSSNSPEMTEYGGLCHWMYRHDNRIYSWGLTLPPNASQFSSYTIIWTLKLQSRA